MLTSTQARDQPNESNDKGQHNETLLTSTQVREQPNEPNDKGDNGDNHISIVAVNSIGASKPTANFTVNTQSLSMYVCIIRIYK